MAGYTRQSTYIDGDVITADHSNDEFDELVAAFNNSTGHKHDGTAAEGPVIGLIGDPGVTTPLNKVVVDNANNRVGVFVDAGGLGTSVEQIRLQDGAIVPVTDNDIDLGTASLEFKDLYIDGTANVDTLVIGTSTGVTSVDTDLTSVSASDDTLASAKAIKTYVDSQVTAQDLDFQGDTGGALNIDLDSEVLTVAGGTGIDTSGSGNTLTVAIDSTVATLTGTQTLTNKTLTTPIISTISNTGTLTLPTSTDTIVGRATTDTLTNKTLTSPVISQISNSGTLTLPTSTDTLVGRATTDTLTNKTINLTSNTLSGTTAQFNTALSDGDFATLAGTETLTNKTLTTPIISSISNTGTVTLPTSTDTLVGRATTDTLTNKTLTSAVLNGTISGTSIKDEDDMVSDSASHLATQQSIKAYVDAQITSNNELNEVTDVTITSVADNEVLAYDTTSSNWINQTASEAGLVATSDIGSSVQAYDAGLTSIAGLTTAADKMLYATASDTYAVTDLSAFGRSLIDDADASAARTTLGLGTAATTASTDYATAAQGALADSALQDLTGSSIKTLSDVYSVMTPTDGQVLTFDTTNGWQAETPSSGGASAGFAIAMAIAL